MRIKVVVPVSTDMWNEQVREVMSHCQEPGTEVVVENIARGPESLECSYDEVMVEHLTVDSAEQAEAEGFSGVVIYCMSDPGLRAAKEKLAIPVVGIGESSYHFASLLGARFGVITAGPPELASTQARRVRDHLRIYALDHKCVSVRSVCIRVVDLQSARDEQLRMLLSEGQKARDEDGADTLVLGCGGMAGAGRHVSRQLGIPVVDPACVALKLCEALVRLELTQSKRCFSSPTVKRRVV